LPPTPRRSISGQRKRFKAEIDVSKSAHQTQWAAQFAVASELCKRGYEISFTLGHNTPLADLMVVSPEQHKQFLIDVKGLSKRNYWQIARKETRDNFFYILALVPKDAPNEFFVLTQAEVNDGIRVNFLECPPEQRARGEKALRLGLTWAQAKELAANGKSFRRDRYLISRPLRRERDTNAVKQINIASTAARSRQEAGQGSG
jgi:hypothetical protein